MSVQHATPANDFVDLTGITFVTAHLRRSDGQTFTVIVRPDKAGMLIFHDTLEIERFTEIEMTQRDGRASVEVKVVPTSENFPFSHRWVTQIVEITVLEN